MTTVAMIVAAGMGHRFGGAQPKQYLPLGNKPVLQWSLEAFSQHPAIDHTVVVLAPGAPPLSSLTPFAVPTITGGASRQESVYNGLNGIAHLRPSRVLIHDAARPLVSADLISRVLAALDSAAAAIPALPVTDTLKKLAAGRLQHVERSEYWRMATPQGFHYDKILAAHMAAQGQSLSDDAAVAELAGLSMELVEADMRIHKLTKPEDMAILQAFLPRRTVTAQGVDVHAFAAGDHVTLGGVKIPFARALAGHSDADVLLHAITDALLGAIGAGDIGVHFPPGDPQWRGTDSRHFLRHAAQLVRQAGGRIDHVDATLICEEPKLTPHRAQMIANIAQDTDIKPEYVSLKATTSEGLGFTGRKEGIAALAAVTVSLYEGGAE